MDRNPLHLGDGGGDLEHLPVRDLAVGLEDDLAPTRFDAVDDGLRACSSVATAPSPCPISNRDSPPEVEGLVSVRKVAAVSSTPTPCRAGGTSTFSPPLIWMEKSMNVMSWKTTSTIGVMSMCSFRSSSTSRRSNMVAGYLVWLSYRSDPVLDHAWSFSRISRTSWSCRSVRSRSRRSLAWTSLPISIMGLAINSPAPVAHNARLMS